MNLFWEFISEPDNWTGSDGIAQRLLEHAGITLAVLAIAAAIAIPVGALVGHGRRGDDIPIAFGALGRLLPPLGVLSYLALKADPGTSTAMIALVLLAIPPMMSAAYTGVRLVDRAAVESARGAGMVPTRVLFQVEAPMAMPELVAGVRRAAVAVVAMTAVAAYVGADGLGRFIIDGQTDQVRDYGQVATGGVLIALLAIALDVAIAAAGYRLVSPGLRGGAARQGPARPPSGGAPAPGRSTDPVGAATGSAAGSATGSSPGRAAAPPPTLPGTPAPPAGY